ncbi:LANO_0G12640g1_1 [Lachancea nothofagi CBS 11611]|uniref:Mitochondrial intermembrane space import and assembly protein 40 n=1 Tax=Lachancea nothofagi CBS 11611 TaxID=1266666 RepID=A0A1G4KJT1_9SACH|nr:LANO_0G12640g1_1 [Lachancea nothofagi CBS 11611]
MFRSGNLNLRRAFQMKLFANPSRHLFTSSAGLKLNSRTHLRTAATAMTVGTLLGFLASGSLIGLETSEKTQSKAQSPSEDAVKASETSKLAPDASEDGESKPQAAYDPDTGVINWDCPCLGGMAQGPCGEEFKAAFSCFVYSEDEPKGIDCIEKFKGMQDCFRKYPEHYADQIKDEEDAAQAAQEMESKNDQTQMVPEAKHMHPEESTPILQQEADFGTGLSPENIKNEAEQAPEKDE